MTKTSHSNAWLPSMAHPYLLADNRHYPFYLWRKVIKAHWSVKYLLVPLYVFSWVSIITRLGKFQMKIWVLSFFLATAAVLVPSPLIEFRYYTIPFFFLILQTHTDDYRSWLFMGFLYITNHRRLHNDDVLVSSMPLVP